MVSSNNIGFYRNKIMSPHRKPKTTSDRYFQAIRISNGIKPCKAYNKLYVRQENEINQSYV